MSSKLLLSFVFAVSLACFGQVVTTGGYATNAGPSATPISAANAPLVATPDVALPGSGPAVGAPLGTSNTNDSRVSAGPSVYNPNAIAIGSAEATTTNATPGTEAATSGNAAAANAEPFEFGVQHVIVAESPSANGSAPSLGEIAKDLRAHHRPATKMINNDTVARFNAGQGGIGSLAPQETTTVAGTTLPLSSPAQGSANTTLMAQNQTPALPQSDQSEATEPPQPAAQPSPTAGQQRHAPATQSSASSTVQSSASAEQNSAPAQNSPANENTNDQGKLPQTATHLPVILLLGGLGVAGGALYLMRR